MSRTIIDHLLSRRSVVARDLKAPGPSEAHIQQILAAAHRVPDHGKIGPWRFVLFEGKARSEFGDQLERIFLAENPGATRKCLEFERDRFMRAPLVIAVISAPQEHKVPEWEQVLSAGAACQNILHAANALGFGAQWLTEWYAYSDAVNELLKVSRGEKIAGYIYIGSFETQPSERNRPELKERISYWRHT